MGAQIETPWTESEESPLGLRDSLFASHVREIADLKLPWLFPLLIHCSAQIYVEKGLFLFAIPNSPSLWYSIPEIGNLVTTVPWVDQSNPLH
jgi:hypothetical protein